MARDHHLFAWVPIAALIWITGPTWHLRFTRGGDFLCYARSPTRPRLIGRTSQLDVTRVDLWLDGNRSRDVDLDRLSPSDTDTVLEVARAHGARGSGLAKW